MSDQIADAIGAVADHIEENGWWRGGLFGPNGAVCIMGGVIRALHLNNTQTQTLGCHPLGPGVVNRIVTTIQARGYGGTIPEWNDDTKFGAKDEQDVLDLIRRAEKIERNGGVDPDE
jgi:hypothetical protein